jgi:hypothetical protein
MVCQEIKDFLAAHADARYAAFVTSLMPGARPVVGVRLPVLRALAKEITKGDWRTYLEEADKFFKNIQEMKITKNDDGSFTYTRETVQRQWDDKMYLFPIPNDVMLKHEKYGQKWEQNPGW